MVSGMMYIKSEHLYYKKEQLEMARIYYLCLATTLIGNIPVLYFIVSNMGRKDIYEHIH